MKEFEKQLKAVANRRRLEIIKYLKRTKEVSVSDLADHLRLSLRSTSKHLSVLASQEVVEREQRSAAVYYRLASVQKQLISKVIPYL